MTLPLPVIIMDEVRAPPIALGAPNRDVPAATGMVFDAALLAIISTASSSSLVNSVDVLGAVLLLVVAAEVCFCTFLGLSSASSAAPFVLLDLTTASLLLLMALVLVLPLLVDELDLLPAVDVIAEVVVVVRAGGGAVCENRHGLRLHGPPGLLADSSGHRTEANSPRVGNIGITPAWFGEGKAWRCARPASNQDMGD